MERKPFTHVAYIDEAGDEGFGKLRGKTGHGQSQWLLLGAAIVRSTNDKQLPTWRNNILDRFPLSQTSDLHFRNLKHEQKIVVCQEITKLPIRVCIVFSKKKTIPGSKWVDQFKRPGYLYNYLTRWLLERISTFCVIDSNKQDIDYTRIKVVFSRRGGTNYQAMKEYMILMRDGREIIRPSRSIDWNSFDPADIVVENHSKWAGLQFADSTTSAHFAAVEPNIYQNTEPRYAEILRPNILRINGKGLNAGITPVPHLQGCEPNEEQFKFFEYFK